MAKAFVTLWLKGLLFKLKQYGIRGNLYKWLENYLCDREQKDVLNGCSSIFSTINAAVP